MSDSIFSRIIRREIPAVIEYEDDEIIAFRDITPQAPVHILVVPKKPIATLNDATPQDAELLGRLMLTAAQIAAAKGIANNGYRLVVNCNGDAGQTVFHVHLHLLGGTKLHHSFA